MILLPQNSFGITLERKAFGHATLMLTAEADIDSSTNGTFSRASAGGALIPAIRWYVSSQAFSGFWFETALGFGYMGRKSISPLQLIGLEPHPSEPARVTMNSRQYEVSAAPAIGYTQPFENGLLLSPGLGPTIAWEYSVSQVFVSDGEPLQWENSSIHAGFKLDASVGYAF